MSGARLWCGRVIDRGGGRLIPAAIKNWLDADEIAPIAYLFRQGNNSLRLYSLTARVLFFLRGG